MPRTLQALVLVSPDLISCRYVSTSSARRCCFFDSTTLRSAYCRKDRRACSCAAAAAQLSPSFAAARCPFSPGPDLVAQPEQTLRTFDSEPSRAEFKESPVQPPIPGRPANPSRRGGGISAGAGVIDRPEPSLRIDGDAKVMPTRAGRHLGFPRDRFRRRQPHHRLCLSDALPAASMRHVGLAEPSVASLLPNAGLSG